nr:MAG TPA: foot protein [Bacteriophage sp.]
MRKIRSTNAVRKKLITAIITATLLIAGCSDTANVSAGQDRTMVVVEHHDNNYWIWRDKETGVMYISAGFNFTVMVNADGTPKIWQGEE